MPRRAFVTMGLGLVFAVGCPGDYSRIKFFPRNGRVLSPGEAVNPDFEPTGVSGAGPI